MKILIPVLNFGKSGGYRVLSKIADELGNLGHTVDFMSPEISLLPYYPTFAAIKWIDSDGRIINREKKDPVINESGISIFRILTKGLKKISRDQYDVIIANQSLTTFAIKLAGLTHQTLYYVQAYEPDIYIILGGFKNWLLCQITKFSYKMKLFTVVNADIYLDYKNLKASRVLYPGIDFNNFYYASKKSEDENELIIGTIGRIEPLKGTRYVVEAFKALKKRYPKLTLHIAFGNADDFSDCDGIKCCQLHGDKELGNFYRSLDYYICAGYSQFGAFHYPVAEAMSCGVPLITTYYYPANENNSWLVSPQSVKDIVKIFEMAYNERELGIAKIKQGLTDVKMLEWRFVGERLNNYINEFVNNKKK